MTEEELFYRINFKRKLIRENAEKIIKLILLNEKIETEIFQILRQNNYFKLPEE